MAQSGPVTDRFTTSCTLPDQALACPLVVDLDGTLCLSDTLFESVVQLLKSRPWMVLALAVWLVRGRSRLKQRIAEQVPLSATRLPYHQALLGWLRAQRSQGRMLVLATAADASIAQRVQAHLQLFDAVLASDGHTNLKGRAKLAAIRGLLGDQFSYAGDSRADIPVWQAARSAVLVGVSRATAAAIGPSVRVERRFERPACDARLLFKALRVHQWVKNSLLFVPLLTAFAFDWPAIATAVAAFMAFSLSASATYLVNDLWDLENDRAHPRKCQRPLASGALPIPQAVLLSAFCLTAGLAIGAAVGPGFLAWLLVYLVVTSAYSWSLKTYVLLDVITLALLYTIRIVAGAAAIGIGLTPWLLAFSMFMFLSLALVKRTAELVALRDSGRESASGRDYRLTDLSVLWPLGVTAAMSSVVVFGLFITTSDTQHRYLSPHLLWLVAMTLIYWLGRLWVKTGRGEMHDDPVVYAFKDGGSRLTVLAMLALTLAARALPNAVPP